MRVLVTDAQMRSSLAVIRSLGKKGIDVTAGEETRFATGFFSKYCRDNFVYPSPRKNIDGFIGCIIKQLANGNYDAIFPVASTSIGPIVDHSDEISEYTRIALPTRNIFERGYDKGQTFKIAMENGVSCPNTYIFESSDELYAKKDEIYYPILIKPRISYGRRGVEICNSFDELISKFKILEKKYGGLLVQEYIPHGGEMGVYTLFDSHSMPIALTVQRRIRSYPVLGGPSTLRETIKNRDAKFATGEAFKLLKAMQWYGVAMVEFRVDARDGIPKLMEVNPRFWGSLQLSILAGVDFPYLLYKMIVDGEADPVMDYKDGVKCRWLLPGDILWYLSAPNKIKNLREFMKFNIQDDIISSDDPGPTFGFILATLRYILDIDMWKFVLRR